LRQKANLQNSKSQILNPKQIQNSKHEIVNNKQKMGGRRRQPAMRKTPKKCHPELVSGSHRINPLEE